MMECKRHKWRVGSKCNCIITKKKIIPTKLNIWCEKCNKRIKVNIYSEFELNRMKGTSS